MRVTQTAVSIIVLGIILVGCANTIPPVEEKPIHPLGKYVTVNGSKLWVEIEGEGEPLLLIAGGPESHTCYHPHFSQLAEKYQVIYFDAYGRGKSDRAQSPEEYTFRRDMEEIEELRKGLGITQWHILGHSYGGLVAQAYALEYPNSVNKLILANTLFSAEMWQANNDNYNHEIRNQYPEVWEKVQEIRNRGLLSSAPEHCKSSK